LEIEPENKLATRKKQLKKTMEVKHQSAYGFGNDECEVTGH
jgi:hypothetical protein